MSSYIALIEITDVGYGVVFPDCPGCTAMGDTFAEAFGHAAEALSDWMSSHRAAGLDAPRPRDLAEIRADPAFAEDFAATPLVTSVPLFVNGSRPVKATVSIEADLLEAIDEAAQLRGLTRSAFLSAAARGLIMAGR